MTAPNHGGYTETPERTAARWERMKVAKESAFLQKYAAEIANCQICLLATAMKDCQNCKFNVGLSFRDPRTPEQIALDEDWQDAHKKNNVEFGSAAWFAGIPEEEF